MKLIKEDNLYVLLELEDGERFEENIYNFKLQYQEIPQLKSLPPEPKGEPKILIAERPESEIPYCVGIEPIEFHKEFDRIFKSFNVEYETILNETKNVLTYRFNGYNVFKTNYNNKNFWVMAHPESLSPSIKRCDAYWRTYRKKTAKSRGGVGETLRSKFYFTKWSQRSIMKTLIRCGLEYRRTYDIAPEDYRNVIEQIRKAKNKINEEK